MVFCPKDEACQRNGKVKKGYKEIQCKNVSVKYMKANSVKRPATKTVIDELFKPKTKVQPKRPAKKTVIMAEPLEEYEPEQVQEAEPEQVQEAEPEKIEIKPVSIQTHNQYEHLVTL
jgi:hypothetical protein